MKANSGDPVPPFVQGSWTLVLIPDTQTCVWSCPHILDCQTQWIVEHRAVRGIRFVLHEGDVVEHWGSEEEWQRASRSMARLDGQVPYAMCTGNHDYETGEGRPARRTPLNRHFPLSLFQAQPTFAGAFDEGRSENTCHVFSASGVEWLVLALEYGPRDEVVDWANRVMTNSPDRRVILLVHAYLYDDGTRYDHQRRPDQEWNPHDDEIARSSTVNDGEELWRKLVSRHRNVIFVFSGHAIGRGVGRLSSRGDHGNVVHQITANYQMRPSGGEGYLRLVEFLPDGRTVQVKTYSPYLDAYLTSPEHQFTLDIGSAEHG